MPARASHETSLLCTHRPGHLKLRSAAWPACRAGGGTGCRYEADQGAGQRHATRAGALGQEGRYLCPAAAHELAQGASQGLILACSQMGHAWPFASLNCVAHLPPAQQPQSQGPCLWSTCKTAQGVRTTGET